MPLVDRATNVLELLLAESRLGQGDIAFVVHSFGGLILQQALRVAAHADVAIIDDRYLNQHAAITHEGVTTPIFSTGDMLAGLQLSANEYAEHMAHCRSSGLAFVHVTSDELNGLLTRANC